MDEVKKLAENNCYIKTMWCGDLACEEKMKEEAGLSSRCMPFEQEHISDVCPCCGKPATKMVYWGKAYSAIFPIFKERRPTGAAPFCFQPRCSLSFVRF